MSEPRPKVGYRELLRSRPDFRRFWFGQIVSFLGDWFTTVAMVAAVASVTDSALAVAAVLVVRTLPAFLVTPFSGPLADRMDRRRLLLLTDLIRGLAALCLIAAHQVGSLWGLYLAGTVMTAASGVAFPVKGALLPMIVPRAEIPAANALSNGSWAAMLAIGAALGGVATEFVGIDASFAIDAGTFALSAVFFFGLPDLPPPAAEERVEVTFSDGVRYLLHDRYVLALSLFRPCMHFAGGVFALIPLFGMIVYDDINGPLYIGLLYGIRGAGSLIGSVWVRTIVGDRTETMRVMVGLSFAALAASYLGLSYAPSYRWACVLYGMNGLLTGIIWTFTSNLLQLEADRRFHGRVFAIEYGALTLMFALSSFVAGTVVDWGYEVQAVVFGMSPLPLLGVGAVVVAAALARRRRAAVNVDITAS